MAVRPRRGEGSYDYIDNIVGGKLGQFGEGGGGKLGCLGARGGGGELPLHPPP